MIYVFLADGFEEIEALTPVDFLRRCGCEVKTVGVGSQLIRGSHDIVVVTDILADEIQLDEKLDMIVLPGGLQGTLKLEKSEVVQSAIDYCVENNRKVAAICASPSILGHKGLLKGRKATCITGCEEELDGAEAHGEMPVVIDGNFITGRGAGVSSEFALALCAIMTSQEKSDKLAEKMLCVR